MYAAFDAATKHTGQPTVILAHTIKGWTIDALEGKNATHQMKKLTLDDLKKFRDRLYLPISDRDLEESYEKTGGAPFYHPGADSPEIEYMLERRNAARRLAAHAGSAGPSRSSCPATSIYAELKQGSGKNKIATTMAFVRLLKDWMKDPEIGERIVPIAPDEYRTFGMDSMFPSAKVYNPGGQQYESVDRKMLLSYKESAQGQMLHEGISEAGAMASATAAGSAYSTHGEHMIPFYIFYSMFGFQRTGDSIWAMADQLARGFLIGATAGRTTLTGEGLQHADGHSPLLAATNPAVVHYDPAFAYEISHIMQDGLERMYGTEARRRRRGRHLLPHRLQRADRAAGRADDVDVEGILKGIHRVSVAEGEGPRVQLLASGVGFPWITRGRSGCSPRTGASRPTLVGDVLERAGPRRRRRRAVEPAATRARARGRLRPRQARRCARVRSSRCPTTCAPSRSRSPAGCPPTTACSVPTASASPTPARPPAASSTSTRSRSSSRRSRPSPTPARSTGGQGRRGLAALPDRRPDRRRGREAGGRRRLTAAPVSRQAVPLRVVRRRSGATRRLRRPRPGRQASSAGLRRRAASRQRSRSYCAGSVERMKSCTIFTNRSRVVLVREVAGVGDHLDAGGRREGGWRGWRGATGITRSSRAPDDAHRHRLGEVGPVGHGDDLALPVDDRPDDVADRGAGARVLERRRRCRRPRRGRELASRRVRESSRMRRRCRRGARRAAVSTPITWWKPGVVIARIAGVTSGPRPPEPTRTAARCARGTGRRTASPLRRRSCARPR